MAPLVERIWALEPARMAEVCTAVLAAIDSHSRP